VKVTCDALDLAKGLCGAPAIGRYRQGCVHEHVRERWLCQDHIDKAALGFCGECYDLRGVLEHDCPIILQAVAGAS
jgi:hypothetical protein